APPTDRLEPVEPYTRPLLHRAVERRALRRVQGEPRPEADAVHTRERRSPGPIERADRGQPRLTEQVREIAPAVPAEKLGGCGVREDSRPHFGEDAVARERAEDAPQRLRIGAVLACEVVDGTRPRRECVRDSEVGGNRSRTRDER